MEEGRKPTASPIVMLYGSWDPFVDGIYRAVNEGTLDPDFIDILDTLRARDAGGVSKPLASSGRGWTENIREQLAKSTGAGRMQRNYTLDAMRGVAACAVVLFHAKTVLGIQIAAHGYLAVDLFFALSGFVIAKSYDAKFAGGMAPASFAIKRAMRFYPLYLLGLAIGLVKELALIAAHTEHAFSLPALSAAFAAGAFYIPFPYRDANMFPLNIPSWSLLFELLVNVAYCATFVVWARKRNLVLLLAVSGLLLAYAIVVAGTADQGAHINEFGAATLRTIFSFGIGVWIARFPIEAPRVPSPVLLALVGGLLLVPAIGLWFDLLFIMVISPALLILGVHAIGNGVPNRVYAYLGAISFPIYAIHRPLLAITESAAQILHASPVLLGVACITGLLIVCPLIETFYDIPIRRYLARGSR